MGQYHPFYRSICHLSTRFGSFEFPCTKEAFSRHIWSLIQSEKCLEPGCRQIAIGAVGSTGRRLLCHITDRTIAEIDRCRFVLRFSCNSLGLDLRIARLLRRFSFSVEEPLFSSKKTQSSRKFPPRRKYALLSFHPNDSLLIGQFYPLIYQCFEPYLCRPSIDQTLYDAFDPHLTKSRVRCSDFFIPFITASYQDKPSQALFIQFKTAQDLIPNKGPYWILPLIFEANLTGDCLSITQQFTGLFVFEKTFDVQSMSKDFSSIVRMIFEMNQVSR